MTERRTVNMIVERQHYPSVLEPWEGLDDMPARYMIRVPADTFPEVESRDRKDGVGATVNVSTKFRPTIIPGEGNPEEWELWDLLLTEARRWNYRLDFLLLGRPVVVIGETWRFNRPTQYQYGSGIYASLIGVNVLGDLSGDDGLDAHIAETRKMFEEQAA